MYALTNCTLIDGTGRKPIHNAAIAIDGNRITGVDTQARYPKDVKIVDLNGLVVMPGIFDLHYHCGGIVELKPGKPHFVGKVDCNNYADAREWSIENGVTSMRSAGDFFPDIVEVRDEINAGKLHGPRFFVTGAQFQAPGGHPGHTIMGGDPYVLKHAIRAVDDAKKARDEVKKLIEGGVDCIKAQLSSLDYWNYPRKVPKLRLDVLDAIVDEAHKNMRRVMVHSEVPDDALDAVRIGTDSIEHVLAVGGESVEMPDELIRMMLDKNTYVVPCMTTVEIYDEKDPRRPKRFEDLKRIIKQLYDAGVNIACGTDAGAPDVYFGKAAHREMEIMVELGMSPMDTIVSATRKSAENLNKGDELGTIEKGKLADIVAVSGNPVQNISDTKNVKLVIKDGKVMVDKLGLL